MLLRGLDLFAVDAAWWRRERRRFRPYIAGEALWDNVYAALLCSHGRAAIVDERALIFHEQHGAGWGSGLYTDYNGYLAALDAPYFSRWAAYVARLQGLRASGWPFDRDRLVAEVFEGPVVTPAGYPRHLARQLRARVRFFLNRPRLVREAAAK